MALSLKDGSSTLKCKGSTSRLDNVSNIRTTTANLRSTTTHTETEDQTTEAITAIITNIAPKDAETMEDPGVIRSQDMATGKK